MKKRETIHILFIGNSYTYYINLPGLLAYFMKTSRATTLKTKMVVEGGANLKMHCKGGKALQEVRRDKYDYVVLQEQSRMGGGYKNGVLQIGDPKTFFEYARRFDTEIKKSGAKTVFFLTWAAEILPRGSQAKLNAAYKTIAKELGAILVPVGPVWQKVRKQKPDIQLYQSDSAHPSSVGTYLIACVFYKTLFNKSPIGLPSQSYEGKAKKDSPRPKMIKLNPKDARFLQKIVSS